MSDNNKKNESTITIGPPDKPYAKMFITERRVGLSDRRKLHTYLADDRRSGKADRRRKF